MIATEQLLADLTEPQRQAVCHVDGPLLIIAGAGSGKTRVITRRVAYLMSQGIPPAQLLAITFTNKAAGEMKQRISSLLGRPLRDIGRLEQPWPMVCTFHSLCLRILRHYAQQLGLPANFTIYDSADQTRIIKDALKALELSSTNFAPSAVHGTISKAKNHLVSAADYARTAGDFYSKQVAKVYRKYQQLLEANNALDFDDLLLKTADALRTHPQILTELGERFQYILIDEYQDTNHAQYILAHALAQKHRNICVVGDPDQSIYAWRGADIRNILEFEKDYPDATVVKLEQNYRSTRTILQIASKLIAHNRQRKEKDLWTENPQGEKAQVFLCQDEEDEARVVVAELKRLHEQSSVPWNHMAVFYRINSLSRALEDELRVARIPYVMARGTAFYERKEIKDALAYLRVIANPADEISLERICNTPPRGIGDAAVKLLKSFAVGHSITLFEAMKQAPQVSGISTRAVTGIAQFVRQLEGWQTMAHNGNGKGCDLPNLIKAVVKQSGLEAMLVRKADADLSGDEDPLGNVNGLITEALRYQQEFVETSLADYLAQVSLVSDVDSLRDGDGAVTLMTLHAAKGLEFPVVVIIGLEEGILPHARAQSDFDQLEEERRLCFVGITRAQQHLILTRAGYRTIYGKSERTVTSQFLGQLPKEAIEVTDRTEAVWDRAGRQGRELEMDEAHGGGAEFRKGQLVRHPTFGMGRIAEISEVGRDTRAVVVFNSAGRKTLILQYARLEAVG